MVVHKTGTPERAKPGATYTYTIAVTNTGTVELRAMVEDDLPAYGTPTGQETWWPVIDAFGGVWTKEITFTSVVTYFGPLTNRVNVKTEEGPTGGDSITLFAGYMVYLPLVTR